MGFNFKFQDKNYLKLIWERDKIKYEKIDFITALEMMKNNEGVFINYYGNTTNYKAPIMKIELKSIEIEKNDSEFIESIDCEHFKITSIEDNPSVYTEKISKLINGIFYKVN